MTTITLPKLPEPYGVVELMGHTVGQYGAAQMQRYGEACARAALSAAARRCDELASVAAADRYLEQNYRYGLEQGAIDCAEAIRALAVGSGEAND